MIPQIGFAEMIVLVLLAIIVVGPKDLPKLMRTLGQGMAKLRGMANEFTQAFDEMGAQEEMAELRRELQELRENASLEGVSKTVMGDDFGDEMRSLDNDIRNATDLSNPKQAD